jgi:hypothetical protein
MGKIRTISLILLMMGFVLSNTSCATGGYSSHRNNAGVKKSWSKSAHKKKPHYRAKAHHKKFKGHSNNSHLHKR